MLKAFLQVAQCQVRFNAGQYLFQLKGLSDIIYTPDGEGLDLVLSRIQGTDEDDWNVVCVFIRLQLLADLIAVHFRHSDVQQNQIRGSRPGCGEGHLSTDHGANFVSTLSQHVGQKAQVGGCVVNDQDVSS